MSMTADNSGPHSLADGLNALRAKSGWIIALGVIFMLAGVVALGSVVSATASAVMIVGIMMIMGGGAEIIAAFGAKDWKRSLLWGLLGALYIAAGVITILNPFAAATILTLFLGFALVFGGMLRIFLAFAMRTAGKPWGWVVISGIITLLLGFMLIAKWPYSSAYALGIFLGVDLIFIGSGWITMGMALKKRA